MAQAPLEWVFCGGMMRSGSTLQYNIAAGLVEAAQLGRRETWVDDHADYFARAHPKGITVFKSHVLSEPIAARLRDGRAFALISFRDIRDATASWQKKLRRSFDVATGLGFADEVIAQYQAWEALGRAQVLVSRYEDMVADTAGEVRRVAGAIGIDPAPETIDRIVETVSAPAIARRLQGLGEEALTRAGDAAWDRQTLVHLDHLNGGEIGRYRRELSPDLIAALTERHRDWLLAHGYEAGSA